MSEFPTFAVSGSMLGALNAAVLAGGGLARLGVLAEASVADVITEADITEIRSDLMGRCGGIITDRNVIDALARLERCLGDPKSTLGPMLAALETAQNNAQNRQAELNDPQARIDRLWARIDEELERSRRGMAGLRPYMTEEQRRTADRLQAEYDAAAPGSPERERAAAAIAQNTIDTARDVERRNPGNAQVHADATEAIEGANNTNDLLGQVRTERRNLETAQARSTQSNDSRQPGISQPSGMTHVDLSESAQLPAPRIGRDPALELQEGITV